MSGPIYSDDGFWMWNGTEWIPATQAQNAVPAQQIDQSVVTNVATEVGVQPEQVAAVAPHFDLNQDGQIDQNEMMQAAQSIANPVNVAAPIPGNMAAPNPNVFTATTTKKGFDWKEKKALLIGGIITIIVVIGLLLFFLLSGGNAIVGTWVDDNNESTFNKDGTFSNGGLESVISTTWEIQGDKLMQTTVSNVDGSEITYIQTSKFELTDNNNAMWVDVLTMVDENGTNLLVNPLDGSELDMPCILLLDKNIADISTYNETAASYQSSKPSWCTP